MKDNMKIVEQIFFIKDDYFNKLYLTLIEDCQVLLLDYLEKPKQYWTICNSNNTDKIAYWKDKNKELILTDFKGFRIEEVISKNPYHYLEIKESTEMIKLKDDNGKTIETDEQFKNRWKKIESLKGLRTNFKINKI